MNVHLAKVLLAIVVLVAGASSVTAAGASDQAPEEEVRFVDEEITIRDALITISDTTLTGPFGSDEGVGDQKYTVDSTVRIDGLHIDHDGTRYTICRVVINVEDVGFHVKDANVESTS